MSAEAISNLAYEIGRLDQLVSDLCITLRDAEPNDVYASHLGHINHSFYNGFEKCLVFVLAIRNIPKPTGGHWHRNLLDNFDGEFGEGTSTIEELRGFRHIFRNTYYYELEFERVAEVSRKIEPLWQILKPWFASAQASTITIRDVCPDDDHQLSVLIKAVMTEIGASGEGYSIHDPEVLAMSQNYVGPRSEYFVLEVDGVVVGGGGFAPLTGAAPEVCELRKMYYYPSARGLGKAQEMIDLIFARAKDAGYTRMYLETIESASAARRLYERNGFAQIGCAQGNTGHSSCDTFYERDL